MSITANLENSGDEGRDNILEADESNVRNPEPSSGQTQSDQQQPTNQGEREHQGVVDGLPSAEVFSRLCIEHMKRTVKWRVGTVDPTREEQKSLGDQGIHNPLVKGYMCWRRSVLYVASPFLLIAFVLYMIDLDEVTDTSIDSWGLTTFGKFLLSMPHWDSLVLLLAIIWAAVVWKNHKKSQLILRAGWLLSFVLSLLAALFPLEMLIDETKWGCDKDDYFYVDCVWDRLASKSNLSMEYAMKILPAVLSFPLGVLQGAIRARGLFPQATMAGWILLIIVPFCSAFLCLSLMSLVQPLGDGFMLMASILLVVAPWLFVYNSKAFLYDTDASEGTMVRTQMGVNAMVFLGLFFIVIWALFMEVYDIEPTTELLTYELFFAVMSNTIGRLLVTTAFATDVVLLLVFMGWSHEKKNREEFGSVYDDVFEEIGGGLDLTTSFMDSGEATSPKNDKTEDFSNIVEEIDGDLDPATSSLASEEAKSPRTSQETGLHPTAPSLDVVAEAERC